MSENHNSKGCFSMNNVAKGHGHSRGLMEYQTTASDKDRREGT